NRLAEPPLCSAALARRLLEGRRRRVGLASLADFFGVPTAPCHRALPDAQATAEILIRLMWLAQELGARRLSDLRALAAPLKRRGEDFVVTKTPTELGPIGSRRRAELAARALSGSAERDLEAPLPRLRERLVHLSDCLRYEEAARLRDRIEALEQVTDRLIRLDRLRRLEACLLAPAAE